MVLEERIAALEGGVGAITVSSGQAALHLAIATVTGAGGHIVISQSTRCCSVWREHCLNVCRAARVQIWR